MFTLSDKFKCEKIPRWREKKNLNKDGMLDKNLNRMRKEIYIYYHLALLTTSTGLFIRARSSDVMLGQKA